MKDKIFIFIIGLLVGAVLATGAFYIYTKSNSICGNENTQMNGGPPDMQNGNGEPPEKPDGEPPEKPDGENNEPPAKPEENNNQENK